MPDQLSIAGFIGRSAKLAAPIGMVGGFIGDVLKPLGPITGYLFVVSLLLMLFAGFMWFKKVRKNLDLAKADGKITDEEYKHAFESNKWLVVFSFSAVATPVLLLFFILNQFSPHKGMIASNVPAIASLQEILLGVQKDVKEVKETTKKIDQKTDQIIQKLDDISKNFESIKGGGVIAEPKTPQEFYHNAKFYELEGNYAEARKAYQAYINFNLEFVDPHLSYQMMLKVQEGKEGAKEVYNYLMQQHPENVSVIFANALLQDRDPQVEALTKFATDHPEFAPAFYQLSILYSDQKLGGSRTFSDKKKEKEYLMAFQKLDSEGKFEKYFIDKAKSDEWKQDAEKRLKMLESMQELNAEVPVILRGMPTNQGLMVTIIIAEQRVKEIFYKLPTDADYHSTGFDTQQMQVGSTDPRPITFINIPNGSGPVTISIKYTDGNGETKGPYDITMNGNSAAISTAMTTLKMVPWVTIQKNPGNDTQTLAYFTAILSYKIAIKEIHYSIDNNNVDQLLKFAPANPAKPHEIDPSDQMYVQVPDGSKFVAVKLVYADGTESEVKTYPVP